jgi:hypothetical protein
MTFKPLDDKRIRALCADAGYPWPDSGLARILLIKLISMTFYAGVRAGMNDARKIDNVTKRWESE